MENEEQKKVGRPRKAPTIIVGFRVREDQAMTFKNNVNKNKEKLLTVNGNVEVTTGSNLTEYLHYFYDLFIKNVDVLKEYDMDKIEEIERVLRVD